MSAAVTTILLMLASMAGSALMHLSIYIWNKGRKDKTLDIVVEDLHDYGNRLYRLELRFAAHTRKVNGEDYGSQEAT